MDLPAVQRSLAGLQERFDDLHQQAEARFAALDAENDFQAKEKEEAQRALEESRHQLEAKMAELEAKGGELAKVVEERDAHAKEKGEAQQTVEELKKQLDEKEAEVRSVKEESELILLQLHQVQEELEHYYLLSRRQAEMIVSSENLFTRTMKVALDLT